jgi:YidC/Oxa1 family membrane protein insertase
MEQRNLLIAVIVSVAILLGWQFLYEQPRIEQEMASREAQQQAAEQRPPTAPPAASGQVPAPDVQVPGSPIPDIQTPDTMATAPGVLGPPDRGALLRRDQRVRISSNRLHGSIRLEGGQFDDLTLADYHVEPDPRTPEITLLSPTGLERPYFAQFGWVADREDVPLPGPDTVWSTTASVLSPARPVTLTWDNGEGLIFERTIALDENYMFTVSQKVTNRGTQPVTLYPYGLISRTGTPPTLGFFILHEGLIGVFDQTLKEIKYRDVRDARTISQTTTGGWLGITDKYWLVALVPDQEAQLQTRFSHTLEGVEDKYQADYLGGGQTVQPGQAAAVTNRLFAGAKEVRLLDAYAENLGIARFDLAVDWGWFYFLTKPIFYLLEYFHRLLGNFGLGILLLTVLIKLAFFPLANKSYAAMTRLKALQPKMTEIRERYKDDRAKQNEAMMRLYKEENANPMAGCLPILIQIPVFFALYKVLFVSIEMRHAPFYGWIRDLSAPDPTNMFTLFGLIPWGAPDFLHVGIWPLIMGGSMWLQQKLNPQPADPTQAKVMMLLPIVFTFFLAQFPAGLVIYWAWNNILSIGQQWVIMRRMGVTASGATVTPPKAGATAGSTAQNASSQGKPGGKGGKKGKDAEAESAGDDADTSPKGAAKAKAAKGKAKGKGTGRRKAKGKPATGD